MSSSAISRNEPHVPDSSPGAVMASSPLGQAVVLEPSSAANAAASAQLRSADDHGQAIDSDLEFDGRDAVLGTVLDLAILDAS